MCMQIVSCVNSGVMLRIKIRLDNELLCTLNAQQYHLSLIHI